MVKNFMQLSYISWQFWWMKYMGWGQRDFFLAKRQLHTRPGEESANELELINNYALPYVTVLRVVLLELQMRCNFEQLREYPEWGYSHLYRKCILHANPLMKFIEID
jgi:hypothetical protein